MTKVDGRQIEFTVRAIEGAKEIGAGSRSRVVIDMAKFTRRLRERSRVESSSRQVRLGDGQRRRDRNIRKLACYPGRYPNGILATLFEPRYGQKPLIRLATPAGFEPATTSLEVRESRSQVGAPAQARCNSGSSSRRPNLGESDFSGPPPSGTVQRRLCGKFVRSLTPTFSKPSILLASPRGLNPCYRRERAESECAAVRV